MSTLYQVEVFVKRERENAMQRNGSFYYLMISNVFSISSHMVFTIQITFSLMLIAHTRRLTHSYILYIGWESSTTRKEKKARKKLLISIHTACKWISKNCEKGGAHEFFFSFVQSFNVETIRYENAPKRNQIETMRIYRNVHRTHTLTQIKYPGSEWWRFFLFYFWAPKPFFWHIKFETEKRLPRYLVRACNANNLDAPRIRGCERQRTNQTCEWENVWKTRVRYIAYYIYLNVSISCACVCVFVEGAHTLIAI